MSNTFTQDAVLGKNCTKPVKCVEFNPEISIIYIHEPSINGDDCSLKGPEGPERQQWDKGRDFLVSLISLTVGLGNIYRFPFAVYRNGGGAFLIPYLIMLSLVGRPLYFLELALGQFTSSGQVKVWSMAPILKGVGYGSMIGSITVVTYYASTVAVLLFFFFNSWQTTLPWSQCDPTWVEPGDRWGMWKDENSTYEPKLMCNETDLSAAFDAQTGNRSDIGLAQLYFENKVLKQKNHMRGGIGAPDWKLALCLLLAWIVAWRVLLKGVKTYGKVAYFTAIFPYTLLAILLIRALTLPDAFEGVKFLLMPDWKKMLEAKVWFAALSQCLFSLNTGFGPLIMLGSYNRFDRNIYRDTWIVSGIDTVTSLLAGLTIFAFLGNLAGTLNVDIQEVTLTENDFAIIIFAEGVSTFDHAPQVFAIIFYLMLAILGVGTAVAYVGAVITVITDQFPKVTRFHVTSVVCIIGFTFGLVYVTPGGSILIRLADYFGAKVVVCIMALVEVLGVAWIYGVDNFLKDVEFMLKLKLGLYWKYSLAYVIPIILGIILIYALVDGENGPSYKGQPFSGVTTSFGWMYSMIAISALPICAYYAIKSADGKGLHEKIKNAMKPTREWGPRRRDLRQDWKDFKNRTE